MGHGMDNPQQGIGEGHAGQALGNVHVVPGFHIPVVGVGQIPFNHFNGVDGQRIGEITVGSGYVGFHGVGESVHARMGYQLLGHAMGQFRIHNGNIRGNFKVRNGVFDALFIVGNDGEGSYFRSRPRGRGNGYKVGFSAQFGQAEHLSHFFKGDFRIFVLDPHGLGCINGRTAADGHNPVRLEFFHNLGTFQYRFHGRIGFYPLIDLHFHAGFLQVSFGFPQGTIPSGRTAASADDGAFALQGFQNVHGIVAMVNISRQSKSTHTFVLLHDTES